MTAAHRTLLLHALTSFTATAMITFTITHMHQDHFHVEWSLWAWHWLVAWPMAFATTTWIAPWYKRLIGA